MSATGKARRRSGFTLVEVCATGVVLGTILLIAWPSLRTLVQRTRARSDAAERVRDIEAARERAILTGQRTDAWDRFGRGPSFFPDGTATAWRAPLGDNGMEIDVSETGRVRLHDAARR